ncbi:hypothetical protein GIB67_042295 [Kingdonia uniflora]|uniref:Aspartyl/Glutamyl-tRNA(Gln) amidotransferase subunit B/E catalytic domain-containing protein n=1 Tax=Kingdonia uniflora TaxID=39325 RepID=A0A7J7LEB0_9MAGN|nr:hypothetical protein GIB67_042295 [Kingdonia uniflora]
MSFPSGKPNLEAIVGNIKSHWGLLAEPKVAVPDFKHIMVMLVSEKDVTRALSRESRQIRGFFYKIAQWTVNFDPKKNSPFAPVWIQFPGLMLHLQNNGIVKELAGLVGKYLITDTTTLSLSRPSTVRVCVKVNLMKELPTKVGLAFTKSFIMEQSVLYERLLRFCTHCVLQGHNKASCTKLHPILIPDKREAIKHGKITTMGFLGQSHNNISIPQTIEILKPVATETKLHTVGLKTAMERQQASTTMGQLMGQIAAPTKATVSRTTGGIDNAKAISHLKKIVKQHHISIMVLLEPFLDASLGYSIGDFNTVRHHSEWLGGRRSSYRSLVDFEDMIQSAGLMEPSFTGSSYTWHKISHLERVCSDHLPLLLLFTNTLYQGPRPFRFLKIWASHASFPSLNIHALQDRIVHLDHILQDGWDEQIGTELRVVQKEHAAMLHNEEVFWREHSRIKWVAMAEVDVIHDAAVGYSNEVLQATNTIIDTDLLECIPNVIFVDEDASLTQISTLEELHEREFITMKSNVLVPDSSIVAKRAYITKKDLTTKEIKRRKQEKNAKSQTQYAYRLETQKSASILNFPNPGLGYVLFEIVSEPDMRTGIEAAEYAAEIQRLVRYLGVSNGNMQEGSLRSDANVSIRPVRQL